MPKLIECPDCLGMGFAQTKRTRTTVSFTFSKLCPTCNGTGKALVKRNVLYVGRPDLPQTSLSSDG
jgi:DnaJ-class molecular chaperone